MFDHPHRGKKWCSMYAATSVFAGCICSVMQTKAVCVWYDSLCGELPPHFHSLSFCESVYPFTSALQTCKLFSHISVLPSEIVPFPLHVAFLFLPSLNKCMNQCLRWFACIAFTGKVCSWVSCSWVYFSTALWPVFFKLVTLALWNWFKSLLVIGIESVGIDSLALLCQIFSLQQFPFFRKVFGMVNAIPFHVAAVVKPDVAQEDVSSAQAFPLVDELKEYSTCVLVQLT